MQSLRSMKSMRHYVRPRAPTWYLTINQEPALGLSQDTFATYEGEGQEKRSSFRLRTVNKRASPDAEMIIRLRKGLLPPGFKTTEEVQDCFRRQKRNKLEKNLCFWDMCCHRGKIKDFLYRN